MSVIVVIEQESEVKPLISLAYQLAYAKQMHLSIIFFRDQQAQQSQITPLEWVELEKTGIYKLVDDEIKQEATYAQENIDERSMDVNKEGASTKAIKRNSLPEIKAKKINGDSFVNPMMKVIAEQKAKLLILPRHEKGDENHHSDKLFKLAPCSTLIVRPGTGNHERIKKVLMPCAGGPHVLDAMKNWHALYKSQGTTIDAMLVKREATHSEVIREVGGHQISKMLSSVGFNKNEDGIIPKVVLNDNVSDGIYQASLNHYDYMVMGISQGGNLRRSLFGDIPQKVMAANPNISIALYRVAKPKFDVFRDRFEYFCNLAIPQMTRLGRVKLHEGLLMNSTWNFDFVAMIVLSTSIATLGLISNSVAVVIGAMLVAPLMTPILAAGLALVQGNVPLMITSSRSILFGFLASLGVSFTIGLLTPMENLTAQVLARGMPGIPDLFIAFVSGVVAAHCMTRTHLSAALPGVAIASALVPPIAAIGIAIAKGFIGTAQGATVLFTVNVICIILGSAITFYAAGIRSRKDDESKRFARRVAMSLIVVMTLLMIPLSSRFLDYITDKMGKSNLPESNKIEQMVRPILDEYEFGKVKDIMYYEINDDAITIRMTVEMDKLPDTTFIHELEKILSNNLNKPVKVSVRARIILHN